MTSDKSNTLFTFQIWHLCLGGGNKINSFSQFDEIFDLPEQSIIRANCKALVGKIA